MSQSNFFNGQKHLEGMFSMHSPKVKFFTESRIEELNESITKELINGDTQISPVADNSYQKPKNRYEDEQRRYQFCRATQEKQELEKKLAYLNKSIGEYKKYSPDRESPTLLSRSRHQNPPELEQLRRKDKELNKQIQLHRQKIDRLHQLEKERKEKEAQESLQKQKQQENQLKERRKKEILQNMKKIKAQMEQREEFHNQSTEKVKQLLQKKQLFQKMEEQFKEKENLTLEERKKKLAQIRNLYRPIDSTELLEHEKRLMELKREKDEIRERERRLNESSIQYKAPYVSSFYRQFQESRIDQSDHLTASKVKVDKVKQFAEHIRENFIPEVSLKKKKELEELLEKEAQQQRLKQQKQEELKKLQKLKGVEYLAQLRKLPKKRTVSKLEKMEEQGAKTARPAYKNYLSHSMEKDSPHKTQQVWSKILTKKELNKKEKARLLQYESEKMEEQLRRKEQEMRLLKRNNQEDIDQDYYHMIKAKLNLLTNVE